MPMRKYENARRSVSRRTMRRKREAVTRQARTKAALSAIACASSGRQPPGTDACRIAPRPPRRDEDAEPDPGRFSRGARAAYSSGSSRGSVRIGRDVRFLRQAALLLPSAFLLVVLLFLLTHGRKDPGFGTYPFFQQWAGERVESAAPGGRFLEQSLVFFVPAYVMALLFILGVAARRARPLRRRRNRRAARATGARSRPRFRPSSSSRASLCMWLAERVALRQAPGHARRAAPRGGRAVRGRGASRCSRRRSSRRLWRSSGGRAGRERRRAGRESIVVLDFGGQYTQLIARRIREARVFSVVLPARRRRAEIRRWNPAGIILSGGPQSVYEAGRAPCRPADPTALGVPVLGLCYGMQWMAQRAGAAAWPTRAASTAGPSPGSSADSRALRRARAGADRLDEPRRLGRRAAAGLSRHRVDAGDADRGLRGSRQRGVYAIQFHPEVRHTEHGREILENFLFRICGVHADWTMAGFRQEKVAAIRRQAPTGAVICALSGGVDSSVTAILLREALGDRVHPILVDHGLMRAHERRQVVEAFAQLGHPRPRGRRRRSSFFAGLAGVTDPEQKRKIIGRTFIEVFEAEAKGIPDARYLAQGTLYPGRHRVGLDQGPVGGHQDAPQRRRTAGEARFRADRAGARALQGRGPPARRGARPAARVPGAAPVPRARASPCGSRARSRREKVAILQKADEIVLEEIRSAGLYDAISQAFAVLLPVRSVGVMGDERTHEFVLAVRAVQTTDFMTADWFRMPHDVLDAIASRVVGTVRGINRVVYDITSQAAGDDRVGVTCRRTRPAARHPEREARRIPARQAPESARSRRARSDHGRRIAADRDPKVRRRAEEVDPARPRRRSRRRSRSAKGPASSTSRTRGNATVARGRRALERRRRPASQPLGDPAEVRPRRARVRARGSASR